MCVLVQFVLHWRARRYMHAFRKSLSTLKENVLHDSVVGAVAFSVLNLTSLYGTGSHNLQLCV